MMFNIGESRVNVSFFFFVAICLALVLDATNTAALALCASVCHEAGHLLAMLFFGQRPRSVSLEPFGCGISRYGYGSYRQEMIIALAGPFTNLALAAVMLVIMLCFKKTCLLKAIVVNISLAAFNLLPIEPLDCGRAVRCFLSCRLNSFRAERTVFIVGVIFLVPLCLAGFLVLIKSGYNITLLLASLYLAYNLLKRP